MGISAEGIDVKVVNDGVGPAGLVPLGRVAWAEGTVGLEVARFLANMTDLLPHDVSSGGTILTISLLE